MLVESVSKLVGFEFCAAMTSQPATKLFSVKRAFISRKKPAVAFRMDDLLNFYEIFVGKPMESASGLHAESCRFKFA